VHKLVNSDPQAMGLDQVYQVFFENNYAIVKRLFGVDVGKIKPGYKADLIAVNYLPPTPLNEENFMGHMIFGLAGSLDVVTTIVNGRVLMRDRRILGVDEGAAYEEAQEVAQSLWGRIS
ncbi:MAG: amidohydrolase family protein, partial [Candidatus Bipolaricaulia bacterium]